MFERVYCALSLVFGDLIRIFGCPPTPCVVTVRFRDKAYQPHNRHEASVGNPLFM
jgi:hypothetical protein